MNTNSKDYASSEEDTDHDIDSIMSEEDEETQTTSPQFESNSNDQLTEITVNHRNEFTDEAEQFEVEYASDIQKSIECIDKQALLPYGCVNMLELEGANFMANFKSSNNKLFEKIKNDDVIKSNSLSSDAESIRASLEISNETLIRARQCTNDIGLYNTDPDVAQQLTTTAIIELDDLTKIIKKLLVKFRRSNSNFDRDGAKLRQVAKVLKKIANLKGKNKRRFMMAVVGGQNCGKSTLVNEILGYRIVKSGAARMSKVIVIVKQPPSANKNKKFVVVLKYGINQTQIEKVLKNIKSSDANMTDEDSKLNKEEQEKAAFIRTYLLTALAKKQFLTDEDTELFTETEATGDSLYREATVIELGWSNENVYDDTFFQIFAYGFFISSLVDHIVVYDSRCKYDTMDIPGTGSLDVPQSSIICQTLKQADLFILAKSCDDPTFKQQDTVFGDFLKDNAMNKIVLVMTKSDSIPSGDAGNQTYLYREIQNSYTKYKVNCPSKLHDSYYVVCCDKKKSPNDDQLRKLKIDISNMMETELRNDLQNQLSSLIDTVEDLYTNVKNEARNQLGIEEIEEDDEESNSELSHEEKLKREEERKQSVDNVKTRETFDALFKKAYVEVKKTVAAAVVYNVEDLRSKMKEIFEEEVRGIFDSLSVENLKEALASFYENGFAVDALEVVMKFRKEKAALLEKAAIDASKKIGQFMYKNIIMVWVEVVAKHLGSSVRQTIPITTEKEFVSKIETLIVSRARLLLYYYVTWPAIRSIQRKRVALFLNEIGIYPEQSTSQPSSTLPPRLERASSTLSSAKSVKPQEKEKTKASRKSSTPPKKETTKPTTNTQPIIEEDSELQFV